MLVQPAVAVTLDGQYVVQQLLKGATLNTAASMQGGPTLVRVCVCVYVCVCVCVCVRVCVCEA